jgi:hypothetical protein
MSDPKEYDGTEGEVADPPDVPTDVGEDLAGPYREEADE